MYENKNVHTFIGCDGEFVNATTVLFGAPFDGTTSYRPGTRFASQAVRGESYGIETYSPYQNADLAEKAVYDAGDIELPFGNVTKALASITEFTGNLLNENKIPVMIGGEHLVTLGAIRAMVNRYSNLNIIHLDAHADLRDDYMDEKYSHATVMRRVWELIEPDHLFQFGIRSGTRDEFEFMKKHTFHQLFQCSRLGDAQKKIKNEPVYITIDLDILDPSVFPGTGTPEAGGISFQDLLHGLFQFSELNIVGADIVELSPPYDPSGISTMATCKIVRELLLLINKDKNNTQAKKID